MDPVARRSSILYTPEGAHNAFVCSDTGEYSRRSSPNRHDQEPPHRPSPRQQLKPHSKPSSWIGAYIDRFRQAPPTAPAQRLNASSTFWWEANRLPSRSKQGAASSTERNDPDRSSRRSAQHRVDDDHQQDVGNAGDSCELTTQHIGSSSTRTDAPDDGDEEEDRGLYNSRTWHGRCHPTPARWAGRSPTTRSSMNPTSSSRSMATSPQPARSVRCDQQQGPPSPVQACESILSASTSSQTDDDNHSEVHASSESATIDRLLEWIGDDDDDEVEDLLDRWRLERGLFEHSSFRHETTAMPSIIPFPEDDRDDCLSKVNATELSTPLTPTASTMMTSESKLATGAIATSANQSPDGKAFSKNIVDDDVVVVNVAPPPPAAASTQTDPIELLTTTMTTMDVDIQTEDIESTSSATQNSEAIIPDVIEATSSTKDCDSIAEVVSSLFGDHRDELLHESSVLFGNQWSSHQPYHDLLSAENHPHRHRESSDGDAGRDDEDWLMPSTITNDDGYELTGLESSSLATIEDEDVRDRRGDVEEHSSKTIYEDDALHETIIGRVSLCDVACCADSSSPAGSSATTSSASSSAETPAMLITTKEADRFFNDHDAPLTEDDFNEVVEELQVVELAEDDEVLALLLRSVRRLQGRIDQYRPRQPC